MINWNDALGLTRKSSNLEILNVTLKTLEKSAPDKKPFPQDAAKVHLPKGFFTDNSAEEIAKKMKAAHKGDINAALKALHYQLNRNKHQSEEVKTKIHKAIAILEKERDAKKK